MKNLILLICLTLGIFSCTQSSEQEQDSNNTTAAENTIESIDEEIPIDRFETEIRTIEKNLNEQNPDKRSVLFTGSSSIRMWDSLSADFAPIPVLNHGFGGSTLPELIHYADRIVFASQPELIVLYCGENDISEGAIPEQVLESYKKLDELISQKLPDSHVIYISMKPSLARWNLWNPYKKGNALIQSYLKDKKNRHFIDCSEVMLNENNLPEGSIFIQDGLHMNKDGYERWTNLIRPKVEELYQK